MKLVSAKRRAAIMTLVPLLELCACDVTTKTCNLDTADRSVDGAITTGESTVRALERRAGSAGAAADAERAIAAWNEHTEGIDLTAGDQRCRPEQACVTLSNDFDFSVFLRWNVPLERGEHRLADLDAEVCESTSGFSIEVSRCVPLEGTLVVRAITAPCDEDSCGQLDAELILAEQPSSPLPEGPFAFGRAQLSYEVVQLAVPCGGCGRLPSGRKVI